MRKIIMIALVLFLSTTFAVAAPFIVCDPQAGVTHYKLTGPAWVPSTVPAQADGSIRMDVSASAVGNNALTIVACIAAGTEWPVERCSTDVPFVFTRPSPPVGIKNIRLIP